jgi:hypothetical protein
MKVCREQDRKGKSEKEQGDSKCVCVIERKWNENGDREILTGTKASSLQHSVRLRNKDLIKIIFLSFSSVSIFFTIYPKPSMSKESRSNKLLLGLSEQKFLSMFFLVSISCSLNDQLGQITIVKTLK